MLSGTFARMVLNVHERRIAASAAEVGPLIDSLSSADDRLWPHGEWPAMRLSGGLAVDAAGGHGPVRYFVKHYEPGRRVEFQFTGPAGFNGSHSFTAVSDATDTTLLRHELVLSPKGVAVVTWPLFFRPFHDALIEECLDRAERECGVPPSSLSTRPLWTRALRATFSKRPAQGRSSS